MVLYVTKSSSSCSGGFVRRLEEASSARKRGRSTALGRKVISFEDVEGLAREREKIMVSEERVNTKSRVWPFSWVGRLTCWIRDIDWKNSENWRTRMECRHGCQSRLL